MRYLLFLLVSVFLCCDHQKTGDQLVVHFIQISLRDAPGKKSKTLRVLALDEKVTDLREVSGFESSVFYNDARYQAPWIKVKTADDAVGWVFAGALRPVQSDTSWLFQKRLQCYFGTSVANRRNRLVETGLRGDHIKNDKGLAAAYRESVALRDTITYLLANRVEPSEAGFQPDFTWLQAVLPGYIVQYVGEGTRPYLFADFRIWREKAVRSSYDQDDAYFHTCLMAYPYDSIESFFPVWKFQLSDNESASQLGAGIHFKMLRQIEAALSTGDLFRPELMAMKESVIEDIVGKNINYWQSGDLILKELNQIINSDFSILGDHDRTALQARLTMFEDPESNGITVNMRSGTAIE